MAVNLLYALFMKKRFKALVSLCLFTVSVMASAFSAEAVDGISAAVTEQEIQVDVTEELDFDSSYYSGYLPEVSYLFNEDSFLYGDYLDENNKSAYEAMKKWLIPNTDEITVSFPETISYQTESTDISKWDETQTQEFWNLMYSHFLYGKNALEFDYPEIFWLDTKKVKVALTNVRTTYSWRTGMYTMNISEIKLIGGVKDAYSDVDSALEYKQLLEDSVDEFEVMGNDRYQQVKYIHDYIDQTVTYNVEGTFRDAATGLFCEPYQLICEGYSKAFKLICDKAGIPCIVVPGNINSVTNSGHMWNYVKMEDEEWYGLDCTWDDTTPVKYDYFLKGSDSFSTNHTPDTDHFTAGTYPGLSTDDYVYNSQLPVTTSPQTTITTTTTTTLIPVTTVSNVTTIPETTATSVPVTTTVQVTTVPVTTSAPVTTTVTVTTTEPVIEHIKGDYNLDDKIDVADLVVLRKVILGISPLDNDFPNDDLNDDGIINIFDYVILSRIILGGT